jgi:retinol dehydrogenase 12
MSFLISQFTPLPVSKADLSGRTVIITGMFLCSFILNRGANVGLGLEAARHLARFNPKKLILACRNQEKGQKAIKSITETTKVADGIVECWGLDLSSFENVKAFARRGIFPFHTLDEAYNQLKGNWIDWIS